MITVIIAGGAGTRLWPLSTPDFPKHLLQLGSEGVSLLQGAYRRAQLLSEHIYVVTDASHAHHVREQLPELPDESFIIEPARRGTASCVLAALAHVGKRHAKDETIAFVPADHYIRDNDGFVHSFTVAIKTANNEKRVVLIGVEPDVPATGFGYIKKGALLHDTDFVFNVESFQEKPDFNTATKFLKSGRYLWNCSYFVGSLDSFLVAMKLYAPTLLASYKLLVAANEDDYAARYLDLENVSIDYALIEKVRDLLVVPASFDWMDLGSYSDLAKAVGADEVGNYFAGKQILVEEVQNTYVENHEDKPVVVIGIDNCVVINTPRGILVARKDLSQRVGDVSKRLSQ